MYCVYWIKSKQHSNVSLEGYVGISKNFKERMQAHKKNKKKTTLRDSILRYGWENLDKVILQEHLTLDEALQSEFILRPREQIGWNLQRGGELGVNSEWYNILTNKEQHSKATSVATKKGIQKKDTTEKRQTRAKQNWITYRESYKDISKGSNNPRALLTEEQVKEIKYILIPSGKLDKEIASLFYVKPYVINFIRTGKNWKHI